MAQLAERLLPTPEVCRSNPVHSIPLKQIIPLLRSPNASRFIICIPGVLKFFIDNDSMGCLRYYLFSNKFFKSYLRKDYKFRKNYLPIMMSAFEVCLRTARHTLITKRKFPNDFMYLNNKGKPFIILSGRLT